MSQPYRAYREQSARRPGTSTLKEAIGELLNTYQLRGKFNETYLVTYWEKLMGSCIASRTSRIYMNNKKLYIQIDSAPLKNELTMAKSKMIELLNREIGEVVVEEVVFI
ncbi:MAG: DUF721 domain-containing protein [Bacteroidota bacterium]